MKPSGIALDAYRPDIDGLRAVAVTLVLLFHAGFTMVPGGFVGVDVFFVISGYLITKILAKDCAAGRFNYFGFLSKRFFRLYPALVATLALTGVGGFLLLSPEHLKTLGTYTASAQFSISNIVFLRDAGYFAASAGTNPLLHTWSLAVEQQFYLFWPILIFLAYRVRAAAVPVAIVLAGATSLTWSQHQVGAAPDNAYFLVQSRIFEFAVGAIIPWLAPIRPKFRAIGELLLLAGLAVIVYCALFYTKHTPFPGMMALLPCVGAALCIYAGQARFSGLLLRNPLMAWIGSISYSVYLVHWPIFVLYRYYRYTAISLEETVVMFLVPFVVAYPMFKLVESPFRRLRFGSMGLARGAAAASVSVLVVGAAWYAYQDNGVAWRLDKNAAEKLSHAQHFYETKFAGFGFEGERYLGDKSQAKVSILLIGDSFAGHLSAGLNQLLLDHHLKGVSLWETGCFVSPKYVTSRNGVADKFCVQSSARIMELLKTLDVPVIYAQSWSGGYQWMLMEKNGPAITFNENSEYYDFLARNIEALMKTAGHGRQFMVVSSPPSEGSKHGLDLKTCLNRPKFIPSDCQNYMVFKQELGQSYAENEALKVAVRSMKDVAFLDTYKAFCAQGECRAMLDDQVTYADGYHLTPFGSKFVARQFSQDILGMTAPNTVQTASKLGSPIDTVTAAPPVSNHGPSTAN